MTKAGRDAEQPPPDQKDSSRGDEERPEDQNRRKRARRSRDFDPTSRGDESGEVR